MIGYRSVQHQGWAAAKAHALRTGENVSALRDVHNPYPYSEKNGGCNAFYEYQDGCNAFRRGDVIDCRGDIVESPKASSVQYFNKHSRFPQPETY